MGQHVVLILMLCVIGLNVESVESVVVEVVMVVGAALCDGSGETEELVFVRLFLR